MSPPPGNAPTQNEITGTRTKAETNRILTGMTKRKARAAGIEPTAQEMRRMLTALRADADLERAPAIKLDDWLTAYLMRAPWFRQRATRKWRVGEGGGWAVRS